MGSNVPTGARDGAAQWIGWKPSRSGVPVAVMPESSPFDHVVCAIDGSEESLDAAYRGWCLAPGCPLTLVHVVDVWDAPAEESGRRDWAHEQRRVAQSVLSDARHELTVRGVRSAISVEVDDGTRPGAVRDLTRGGMHQLLTMGSGEQAEISSGPPVDLPPPTVDRLTRRVLDVAGSSVLINRLGTESSQWPRSITVGVDGSAVSLHAYMVATALAGLTGAKVTVVMAVKHKLGRPAPTWPSLVPTSVRVVEDVPADAALIKTDWHSDLVVVGRTGAHRSRGMGTTSQQVAAFSPVPVLVVHRSAPTS